MLPNKNYSADETQILCDICSEAVTNPLCPFCLTEEIKAWLTLYPALSKELLPKLNQYLIMISNKITSYGTECIKCKDKRAFVCPYCFTNHAFNELQKLGTSKMILQEYFEFFNFDHTHTGYTKELEEMEAI